MLKESDQLVRMYGPSGFEKEIREYIQAQLKETCHDMNIDAAGNLVIFKKGRDSGTRQMITAHMDQSGFMVTGLSENRRSVSPIGLIDSQRANGARVVFANGRRGILNRDDDGQWYVDTGDCANEFVAIGDIAVFDQQLHHADGIVTGAHLDNRLGCQVLMNTIRASHHLQYDTWFVFTVQNHSGRRGAQYAAHAISPHMALTIDASKAAGPTKEALYTVKVGEGPCIKVRDSRHLGHDVIRKNLQAAADQAKVTLQYDSNNMGELDTSTIHTIANGIMTGAMTFPVSYLNSACELCSEADLRGIETVILQLLGEKS